MHRTSSTYPCLLSFVPKSDSSQRLVAEYKPVNATTIPETMALARMGDLLAQASQATMSSLIYFNTTLVTE